jgi:hypothetical protein
MPEFALICIWFVSGELWPEWLIGWQGGKPLPRHLYETGRNKPKGQGDAAKNGEIANPLAGPHSNTVSASA